MSDDRLTRMLDELSRDLDLLLFRLEQPTDDAAKERPTVKRQVERLRRLAEDALRRAEGLG